MYSRPVCPPGYVKKLQSPSMDFALRASVASRHCSKMLPAFLSLRERPLGRMPRCREAQGCARAAIGQESRCHEAQGCVRMAISSFFTSFALLTVHPCTTPHYASQANRTTLHAVITMDGVRAGFAWSKNLPIYGF